jgi:5-methyltetrahydrofolate--homocysteine methyltransferase
VGIVEMLEAVAEHKADAIGMSGLLVKSTLIMRENLEELNRRGMADVPVLLGGAALTRTYVERDLREVYEGRLFYGKDAFEGLHTMDRLGELRRTGEDDAEFGRTTAGRNLGPRKSELRRKAAEEAAARGEGPPAPSPEVARDNPLFRPPFVGSRVAKGIPIDDIAGYLNETALFRNQWGYRPDKALEEDDATFKNRIRPQLRELLAHAKASQLLVPQVAWGHFAANSDGDDLIIWKDESRSSEWVRFNFPRQFESPWLCISDFFRSADSGDEDWASFMIVTQGSRVTEEANRLRAEDRYQDYLFLHGLGVEMAEALAEYWHLRIRQELGYADEDGPTLTGLFRQQYRGGRYSWGYPACPDLEGNAKAFDLVGGERIGVKITENFMYEPEQTTSAIICHHPQAKYFVA